MSLPTNRMPGDIIQAVDINQIAEAVNALSDSGTSGSLDATGVDLGFVPVAQGDDTWTWAAQSGTGGTGVSDHGGLTGLSDDDHVQYALADGTRGAFAATDHSHAISGVTGLQDALDGKAATAHTHDDRYYTEGEVDTALSGKANTSHSHPVTDLTATGTPSASTYLRGDGAWATPAGGGGGAVDSIDFVQLKPSGTQNIGGGEHEILWPTEVTDTAGLHSTTTNTGRIVAVRAGVYSVDVQVAFRGNNAGTARAIILKKNGVVQMDLAVPTRPSESTNDPTNMPLSTTIALNAGDYITIHTWSPAGAVGTPDPVKSNCAVARIGALT